MRQEVYWRKMADKQQEENIMRMRAEEEYRNKIKKAYMNELSSQLRVNEQMKRKERELAKQEQQQLINQGIEKQKRQIEREGQRKQLIHQREELMVYEGKTIEEARKEDVKEMKARQKMLEQQAHELARLAGELKAEEELRKKRNLNHQLLESIEESNMRKKKNREYQLLREKAILNEGEHKKLIDEIRRAKFYHDLRQKSKVVDYGVHGIVEQKMNGRLLDRKREEWQKQREAAMMNERVRQIEQRSKHVKSNLEQQYRQSLKEQMELNEALKRQQKEAQVHQQRRTIEFAEALANERAMLQQSQQQKKKKELGRQLQEQARERQSKSLYENEMNTIQAGINRQFLGEEPRQRRSIDTFELDHFRKRQYATLEKSLNSSTHNSYSPGGQKDNYFARKGYSILN